MFLFTSALKAELPLSWLQARGIRVTTPRMLAGGSAPSVYRLGQISCAFLVTGAGEVSSENSAKLAIERFQPSRVFNFGTATAIGSSALAGKGEWVLPSVVTGEGGEEFVVNLGEMPFSWPAGPVLRRGGTLFSAREPSAVNFPSANFLDMEALAQARVFAASKVDFHVFKGIADRSGPNSSQEVRAALRGFRRALELILGGVSNERH